MANILSFSFVFIFLSLLIFTTASDQLSLVELKELFFPARLSRVDSDRISNGNDATPNEFPFIAMISGYGSTMKLCAGSLIANQYILTHASCFYDDVTGEYLNLKYSAILGAHDVFDKNATTDVAYFPDRIIIHPDFNFKTKAFDVALMEFNTTIQFTKEIKPICLAEPPGAQPNQVLQIAGWGVTLGPLKIKNILQKTTVTVDCDSYCELRSENFDTTSMFCASGKDSGFCQRDFGGPAFTTYDGRESNFIQYGIISFGDACINPNDPGYYTDVSSVKKWIQKETNSCLC